MSIFILFYFIYYYNFKKCIKEIFSLEKRRRKTFFRKGDNAFVAQLVRARCC
uniref:Uncharacterized protein n=1 Tax=viral metagenome TaxID=1070528 RepID=A0A6C0D0V0_9ZZZZ